MVHPRDSHSPNMETGATKPDRQLAAVKRCHRSGRNPIRPGTQAAAADQLICTYQRRVTGLGTTAHNDGSARVIPGRACHTVLRCLAGINRGRGYRLGTGWASLGSP